MRAIRRCVFRQFIARACVSQCASALDSYPSVLHSFLSGVTRAARGHAPLFIINEGEDRGKGQWGERKRAAGTHAQKKRKEKGGRRERRRRDLLEGEERRGERDRRRGGREGGGDTEREETRISSAEAATPSRAGAAEEATGGA